MSIKQDIIELMQPNVKLTADEIAGALDLPVLSVRPRVCELSRSGWLKPSGHKKNRKGNNMIVWTKG